MEEPALDRVRAHFDRSGVARQKWPELVLVVDDYPRTASGKVQKHRVRHHVRTQAQINSELKEIR